MSSKLQLISFIISFLYGLIFYILTVINFKLIETSQLYIKHILSFIFVLDMVIIYIILLYYVNKGYFHIYFIITVFIGFFIGYILKENVFSKIDVNRVFKR